MDLQTEARIVVTVLGFILFLGICFWAFSRHNKASFDQEAQRVFLDDDLPSSDKQT
ncbi:cbb3-type cytochrome oxidase subunit 3 [Deefgea salmonis]|uniref:CcoQ/FixQ family Cbb3-type cytochrome c oxidase assembly chaperone n=1 Tax=Deefgea salmonis TaxID=2875502 RepID=A0ABS8BHF1_9NEIS|nr:CcoQ/FixQ family Cbb3-type cytochrome c oxidase assembly chaperone [Deefgea salmonis]MCB5195144.1 CcoQ/FixQ family Cbb3-type cytochrome c oxidase assembly chaperone [Deefgea salmonis]